MFNVNTVIGINSDMSRPSENKKKDRMDYRKELQEIIKKMVYYYNVAYNIGQ